MPKYDYAVTKVQEYFGSLIADNEADATRQLKDYIEYFHDYPDTEDILLNIYKVEEEDE